MSKRAREGAVASHLSPFSHPQTHRIDISLKVLFNFVFGFKIIAITMISR